MAVTTFRVTQIGVWWFFVPIVLYGLVFYQIQEPVQNVWKLDQKIGATSIYHMADAKSQRIVVSLLTKSICLLCVCVPASVYVLQVFWLSQGEVVDHLWSMKLLLGMLGIDFVFDWSLCLMNSESTTLESLFQTMLSWKYICRVGIVACTLVADFNFASPFHLFVFVSICRSFSFLYPLLNAFSIVYPAPDAFMMEEKARVVSRETDIIGRTVEKKRGREWTRAEEIQARKWKRTLNIFHMLNSLHTNLVSAELFIQFLVSFYWIATHQWTIISVGYMLALIPFYSGREIPMKREYQTAPRNGVGKIKGYKPPKELRDNPARRSAMIADKPLPPLVSQSTSSFGSKFIGGPNSDLHKQRYKMPVPTNKKRKRKKKNKKKTSKPDLEINTNLEAPPITTMDFNDFTQNERDAIPKYAVPDHQQHWTSPNPVEPGNISKQQPEFPSELKAPSVFVPKVEVENEVENENEIEIEADTSL
ncbi:MAG: hypothetical protein ACTSUE_22820 [Promethearchaeota archaeon]